MGSALQVQSMILFEMATCSPMCQCTPPMCAGAAPKAAEEWGLAHSCFVTCLCLPWPQRGLQVESSFQGAALLVKREDTLPYTPVRAGALCEFGVSIAIGQSESLQFPCSQVLNRTGNFQSVGVQIIPALLELQLPLSETGPPDGHTLTLVKRATW